MDPDNKRKSTELEDTIPATVPEQVPKKIRKPRTIKVDGEKKSGDSAVKEVPELKKKKKRKKSKKKVEPKDVEKNKNRGVEYLMQWKTNFSIWKFEKLRQIWLIENMLDATQMTDELFLVFMEYISAAKGKVIDLTLEKAAAIVKTVEEGEEPDVEDIKYQRARTIIQSLDNATE